MAARATSDGSAPPPSMRATSGSDSVEITASQRSSSSPRSADEKRTARTASIAGALEAGDARAEAEARAAPLGDGGHALEDLPDAEARIPVAAGVGARPAVAQAGEAQRHVAERGQGDALRRPVGGDLRRRDAPQLVRVGAEEGVVQAPAEALHDPIFERDVGAPPASRCRP